MEYDKKIYCSGNFLESKKGQNGSFGSKSPRLILEKLLLLLLLLLLLK